MNLLLPFFQYLPILFSLDQKLGSYYNKKSYKNCF